MRQVSIRPVWTIRSTDGRSLPPRLVELLESVQGVGSLQTAARALGISYRHAWDLVRQGEAVFDAPLLEMVRGKGSRLTLLGERLVRAEHRILARLEPVLDSLASELAAEIDRALSVSTAALRLHASHGFAIERLVDWMKAAGVRIELSYGNSGAAAAALQRGDCDLAGLHVPIGPMQDVVLAHYERWLAGLPLSVIDIATRRQGLMVRAGNPREVFTIADLPRPGVRFINRQPGSGTRLLLEALLRAAGLDADRIAGFEQGEYTHSAVAAHVASGMADVGFGLEPPARRFGLDFVPIAVERYFLLCRDDRLEDPAVTAVISALSDPGFRARLGELPGYDATLAGAVTPIGEAFRASPG
jgi:molybdate transport repressor ModE-like protein